MAFVIFILFFCGLVFVSATIRSARTSARKSANAATRRTLEVESELRLDQLTDIMSSSLQRAGAVHSGSFDGTHFFSLRGGRPLELKTWSSGGLAYAKVALPTVRSSNGRPENIAVVGSLLMSAARSIQSLDPTARII